MKCLFPRGRTVGLSLVFALFFSHSLFADVDLITRYFSGVWDQPEQENQGILLQIGEQDGDKKVGIAYWFTYGDDLESNWYLAVGPITGNEINMRLLRVLDVAFMEDAVEAKSNVEQIGTMDLVFKNCNHGRAYYDTPEDVLGSGDFPIKRIAHIYRTRCSGGISDDTPAGAKPLQLEVELKPVAEDGAGKGKAKFWERSDRSDFKVTVEDMPEGAVLTLNVCGEPRGELTVEEGEGALIFRSPAVGELQLLDFDPRECPIEVLDGETVVLSSGENVLGDKVKGKGRDKDEEEESGISIEVDLSNTGVIEGAAGEAEYESGTDESEFSVEIRQVPAGTYTLVVAGNPVGEIVVIEVEGSFEGSIEFSDPQEVDTLELNFDPRGAIIEVLQEDEQVVLEVLFPDE